MQVKLAAIAVLQAPAEVEDSETHDVERVGIQTRRWPSLLVTEMTSAGLLPSQRYKISACSSYDDDRGSPSPLILNFNLSE